ncbi:MAG: hypothetical protein CVV64_05975 [Candidatus Wallbacteria bacterium HGW-Wallbacteria-1]|jgi:aminoglycoside N3'-acetyltransferase|uniref:Aminoglycoside N(3)-acetyltransferase n=1 Tax=Candidatus Wallbacteria bacterium HGW-Wallbacteria-1 TaxID=2013854 RepID=A0A2N1PSJ7_9BACT|nr:MAG: hypothetical protein CVV64_05975 [Candidatus Wallbacteria bacterium HGW-Wallbacteria-1]
MVRKNSLADYRSLLGRHIDSGDAVLVHTDLSMLGIPVELSGQSFSSDSKERFMGSLLSILGELCGSGGTLMVPAFTYSYARHGIPFVLEDSISEVCMFSEFFRKQSGAIRSLHPLFSLSALGADAAFLCTENGRSAYGYGSPMERLCRLKGKILFLGAFPWATMTFIHHIEHMAGVPYFYHKAFDNPVFAEGNRVPGPFFAYVRHLQGVVYSHRGFTDYLLARGAMIHTPMKRGGIWSVKAEKAMELGFRYLQEHPFGLIEKPFYGSNCRED